ncbi:MAG: hypothetical protein KIT31_26700, partial [Deltaproteobacteria bacterium]|nr:hypothetical protein [Deltaproteobacteria bacterium]
RMRTSFLATKGPHAERLWLSADVWYTRYANAWTAARQTACTRRGSGAPDDATQAIVRCLDVRLEKLEQNLEIHVAQTQTARVPMLELILDPIATCVRDQGETRTPQFDEVSRLRMAIVGAQQTWLLGQHDAAHQQIDEVLARADAFGYGPLRAEVHLMRAILANGDHDVSKVEAALRKALNVAEASADDRAKTIAATRLAVALLGRGQVDEAEPMVELAESSLARYGTDISLEPELLFARGKLAAARRRHDDAVKLLEQSVELAEANVLAYADALFALAEVYKAMGRDTDARRVRDRLQASIPSEGSTEDAVLQAGREQMRLVEQCTVDFDSPATDLAAAEARCKKAVESIDAKFGVGSQLSAMAHWFDGQFLDILDRTREAHEHYERAAKAFETHGNQAQVANAREACGRMLLEMKEYDRAIESYEKAIAAASSLGPVGAETSAFATAGLGRALVAKGSHAEALGKLEEALAGYAKMRVPPAAAMSSAKFALAKAKHALAKTSSAREDARLDAQLALRSIKEHREKYKARRTEIERLGTASANRRIAEIEAWLASH